ncbi:MAG: hypothetical protein GY734_15145 [Herbaspirillum sp.]|uniref:hypothetical protein n=1 Tax=unclassified Herbaspirillum TaxID=2624150 RepID=UPI00257CE840|nr:MULTISPECIES: hypothetical protein [unclassified Herbaspirillum]MCP3653892.1 hypothetical protein [Herbaspirillum sp.]MCP3947175.1 hypothetical protein [Herbaspirillum sp.]MCP4032547.1 hypothetical protein [Herbaspirillum sp.]MCP4555849.1 hypothetical protein [Herbaspirillum sp.]
MALKKREIVELLALAILAPLALAWGVVTAAGLAFAWMLAVLVELVILLTGGD